MDVTVTVVDLEEPGVLTVDNLDPGVGDDIRFELSDPDGGIVTGAVADGGFIWITQKRMPGGDWVRIVSGPSRSGQTYIIYRASEDDTGYNLPRGCGIVQGP